jgi:hypothetical protein
MRPDPPTSQEREGIKKLRKEVSELRRTNEILKAASVFFSVEARRRPSGVSVLTDEHGDRFGVEPICRVLGVSASAYYRRPTGRHPALEVDDERLLAGIRETHEANYEAYGWCRASEVG